MKNFTVLIAVYVVFCDIFAESSPLIGNNVKPARMDEFPFIVSIQYFGKYPLKTDGHICGGTLISKNHVLTTDHCICGIDLRNLRIVLGSSDLRSSKIQSIIPTSKISYEHWAQKENVYASPCDDVSILEFYDEIKINPVEFNGNDSVGSKIMTAGWGNLNDGQRPSHMHRVSLKIMSNEQCSKKINKSLQKKIKMVDRYMCADADPWALSAPGDSGNPVFDAEKKLVAEPSRRHGNR
ncbi:hypothetical protein QAD02_006300 [Eretmocerus hayati]|uniref:Uncharacterized protein n=1 Tax=Eretmocerus hayati TaxID=131215 RepID=A0ACC2N1K1_9HYME|nr:hypothetical protein QAD02_006300 [Eretmocerus hayati]